MFWYIPIFFVIFLLGLFLLTLFLENKWSKDKYDILEILEQPTPNLKKIRSKPTLEDGNCFYSAIYRSLLDKDILEDVVNSLKLNFTYNQNENTFISELRYFLSMHPNLIRNYNDLFQNMIINFQDKEFIETFKYILTDFGDTRYVLIKFYQEKKFDDKYLSEFIQDIQNLIQMNQTFVGEIEVNTLLQILKDNSHIESKIFHEKEKAILFAEKERERENLLILLLENEHWTYL